MSNNYRHATLEWRLLYRHAAELVDAGRPATIEGSIGKLVSARLANAAASLSLQIHGGYGYIREYEVERLYRDARLFPIGGGSSEIQQKIIADNRTPRTRLEQNGRPQLRRRRSSPGRTSGPGDGIGERATIVGAPQHLPAEKPLSRAARRRNRRLSDILTATADVLAEHGYHETNLDEIAARLDLTRGSLYHYFASKEELVTACLDWVATLVNERLSETARQEKGTAGQWLAALIETQLDCIVREYPQLARLFLQPHDWPAPLQQRSKALRLQHDEIFRSVIEDGIATGEFTLADADRPSLPARRRELRTDLV